MTLMKRSSKIQASPILKVTFWDLDDAQVAIKKARMGKIAFSVSDVFV